MWFCWGKLCVEYGKHQLFFPKARQGGALGLNGGLGNLGVSVMQLVAPLVIGVGVFAMFSGPGVVQPDGSRLWLENAAVDLGSFLAYSDSCRMVWYE